MKQKYIITGIFCMLSVLSVLGQPMQYDFFAPNQKGDTLYYIINKEDSNTVSLASSHYIVTDTLFIPAKVSHEGREFAVTCIGSGAFHGSLTMPKKNCAFPYVDIAEGIRTIGSHVFDWNESLREITFPASCEYLEFPNFRKCPGLRWMDFSRCAWTKMGYTNLRARRLQIYALYPDAVEFVKHPLKMSCYVDEVGCSDIASHLKIMVIPQSVDTFYSTGADPDHRLLIPHLFLPPEPPVFTKTYAYPYLMLMDTLWYPCGSDSSYQNSWLKKACKSMKPGLFLENGYMDIDSACPAECRRKYGFEPDSIGVWIVKKYNQSCGCDSVNVYLVHSLLPDAMLYDSSISVEPDRKDTAAVWTWEGTGVEYHVYREEMLVATVTEPFYRDTDILPGVPYCYNFAPVNAYGCEGEWSTTNCYTLVLDDGIGEAAAAASLRLRPNPARERIFIENLPESLSDAEVLLCDPAGREVLRQNGTTDGIDISALARGVYFLRIGSLHGKFVKE